MFVYCVDESLKNELLNNGFKLLNEDKNGATFLFEKGKFNFENVDKRKFLLTNKMNF